MNKPIEKCNEMTRQDFCNGLLMFLGCLLGPDSLAHDSVKIDNQSDELSYFLRKLPTLENLSVCFVGLFSYELFLSCFDRLGKYNVEKLMKARKLYWLTNGASEQERIDRDSFHILDMDEFRKTSFENLISVIYEPPDGNFISDEIVRMVLGKSISSIVALNSQRVLDCSFLPLESRGWRGDVMTIGTRAVVTVNKGDQANEV